MQFLNFGGHPALHRYNALLYRSKQTLRETEYSQFMREIHARPTKRFYRRWASLLGIHMVSWGQALTRFGTAGEKSLSS